MKDKGIVIIYNDFSIDFLEILKKVNIKSIGLHSLYQFGGVKSYLEWLNTKETQDLIAKFENEGFSFTHFLHAVDYLLPRDLYQDHPDWFRENEKGQRTNDWNLCPSNKQALSYLENSSFDLAKKLKQKNHYYHLWLDDSINSFCHCEKCQNISPFDQNMIVVKSILKGLKKYDQEAMLSFLAYQDSFGIPKIKPPKDIFLEFAPINRNHNKSIDSDDENNVNNRKVFDGLAMLFTNNIHILEYYLDVSYFCNWKKEDAKQLTINKDVLQKDLLYYKSKGATSIYSFAGFVDKSWIDKYGDEQLQEYSLLVDKFF